MSTVKIFLTKAELFFMKEAMEEKFKGWMEELDSLEEEKNDSPKSTFVLGSEKVEALKKVGLWKTTPPISEQPKKLHWTQTPAGKKIMAARKRKGSKK